MALCFASLTSFSVVRKIRHPMILLWGSGTTLMDWLLECLMDQLLDSTKTGIAAECVYIGGKMSLLQLDTIVVRYQMRPLHMSESVFTLVS